MFSPIRVHAQAPILCGYARLQLNHQVFRRHNSSRPDYQQWLDRLQRGGEGPGSVVPEKKPLTQWQQNKGADCGLQETAEGARPYPHRRDSSREVGMFLGVNITGARKCSTHPDSVVKKAQQRWRNLIWPLKPSQTFTDAQLRASCRAVSPPGTTTAPPATAGLSRGWCGLPNASPGAHCPPAPDVTGNSKR